MDLGSILWWVVALCIYFLPTICVAFKGASRLGDYFLFNVLIGWTIVGWLVLMSLMIEE